MNAIGPGTVGSGFGLAVRGNGTGSGVAGGMRYPSSAFSANEPMLYWDGQTVGGKDFTLSPGYHIYRIDVRGTDYTLSIDGQTIVQFPIHVTHVVPEVSIWSVHERLKIKSLTVTRLPGAAPLPSIPPVQSINLNSLDVPAAMSESAYYFLTSVEITQPSSFFGAGSFNSGSLDLGHLAEFNAPAPPSSGLIAIQSFVIKYTSTAGAQAVIAKIWSDNQKIFGTDPSVSLSDLSGLGDEAHVAISDDTTSLSGFVSNTVGILFRHGPYVVAFGEYFIRGTVSHSDELSRAETLTTTIDKRIQAQGSGLEVIRVAS
jgi:hypothetical protein